MRHPVTKLTAVAFSTITTAMGLNYLPDNILPDQVRWPLAGGISIALLELFARSGRNSLEQGSIPQGISHDFRNPAIATMGVAGFGFFLFSGLTNFQAFGLFYGNEADLAEQGAQFADLAGEVVRAEFKGVSEHSLKIAEQMEEDCLKHLEDEISGST
ncbi:MAG: hypothetical protein AAF358_25785, partial [Pseudomonadota bacterium]